MSQRAYLSLAPFFVASLILAACSSTASSSQTEPSASEPASEQPVTVFECTDAIGCVDIAPGEAVHIAWIQTVTGITAPLGQTNVNGAEVALDEINFELLGHPIQWDGQDSSCSIEGGREAAILVSSDPTVVAIIGTTCSDETRGAMPLISEAGMVMISSSNLDPDLTDREDPDRWSGYLRTAPSYLLQARLAAEFAYEELGLTRAATVTDHSLFADSMQAEFTEIYTQLGGTITTQESVNVGDTDMTPVLTLLAAGAPQIIYFPIFEPEGNLIAAKRCEIAGLENTISLSSESLLTSTFPSAAGFCAVGTFVSGIYVNQDTQVDFLASYNRLFGESPATAFAAHSYDAMKLLLAAIQEVVIQDQDGTLHIPRQSLRDALYSLSGFHGLTGLLNCDSKGDCASSESLVIYQVNQQNVNGSTNVLEDSPYWASGQ